MTKEAKANAELHLKIIRINIGRIGKCILPGIDQDLRDRLVKLDYDADDLAQALFNTEAH